jgi:hypothetical protein
MSGYFLGAASSVAFAGKPVFVPFPTSLKTGLRIKTYIAEHPLSLEAVHIDFHYAAVCFRGARYVREGGGSWEGPPLGCLAG